MFFLSFLSCDSIFASLDYPFCVNHGLVVVVEVVLVRTGELSLFRKRYSLPSFFTTLCYLRIFVVWVFFFFFLKGSLQFRGGGGVGTIFTFVQYEMKCNQHRINCCFFCFFFLFPPLLLFFLWLRH